jgi:hypothetical protein
MQTNLNVAAHLYFPLDESEYLFSKTLERIDTMMMLLKKENYETKLLKRDQKTIGLSVILKDMPVNGEWFRLPRCINGKMDMAFYISCDKCFSTRRKYHVFCEDDSLSRDKVIEAELFQRGYLKMNEYLIKVKNGYDIRIAHMLLYSGTVKDYLAIKEHAYCGIISLGFGILQSKKKRLLHKNNK